MYGENACDLDDLVIICNERNIKIIEDASESLGTVYNAGDHDTKHTGNIGIWDAYHLMEIK